VFEKSRFAAETGAALIISCNGARVLSRLGFSFERARGCNVKSWDTVDGITLTGLSSLNLENAETQFGAPLMSVHRVDLHNELLRLASTKEHTGGVGEVTLRLNSRVVGASAEEGRVELADGTVHHADLIVAADGVHSILRNVVLGCEAPAASVTGLSAFRFLIPTVDVLEDPLLVQFLAGKNEGPTVLADTEDVVQDRHIVWYGCQGWVTYVGIL